MSKTKTKYNYSISMKVKMVELLDKLISSKEVPEWRGRSRSEVVDTIVEDALISKVGEKRFIKEIS